MLSMGLLCFFERAKIWKGEGATKQKVVFKRLSFDLQAVPPKGMELFNIF